MNLRSSSYTGRSARSLNEAFGPYTSREFTEPREYSRAWWFAMAVIAIVGGVLIWGTK